MSGAASFSLVRRALQEHRRVVVPLVLLLALNVLVYAFYVYPLSRRVNNAASLTAAAEAELAAARLQHAQANALLTGPARAAKALETFYTSILPSGFVAARSLPSPRLTQLARQAGLQRPSIDTEVVQDRDATLTRLKIAMSVTGTYDGIRRFIHALEQAPEFVVIENVVSITEQAQDDPMLDVELELSTFFKSPSP